MKKSFEIDLSSESDIKKHINVLKSYLGSFSEVSRKQKHRDVFSACFSIFQTDISDLYEKTEERNFYVYVHCEPKPLNIGKPIPAFLASLGMKNQPFYVGKGCGDRAFDLDRNETHRKVRQRLKDFGQEVVVEILFDNLTKHEALAIESKLIDICGLKTNGGCLVNLDEGHQSEKRRNKYYNKLKLLNKFYEQRYSV
jgi:hypothetical protein